MILSVITYGDLDISHAVYVRMKLDVKTKYNDIYLHIIWRRSTTTYGVKSANFHRMWYSWTSRAYIGTISRIEKIVFDTSSALRTHKFYIIENTRFRIHSRSRLLPYVAYIGTTNNISQTIILSWLFII